MKVKAPNVLEDVAIEVAIKGLRIGSFVAHLAKEKPRTIEDLYNEFEMYYRSNNDLHRRLEEQNQSKQFQSSNKNTQKSNRSQGQSQPQQAQSQQVFNIEQGNG
jgi:hypothetical protein